MASTVKTRKRAPKKTSPKKRPNKKYILQLAEFRGFMTSNEKVQLATLEVKNAMQRLNNLSMADDVTKNFNAKDSKELISLMKGFVKEVNSIIKRQ